MNMLKVNSLLSTAIISLTEREINEAVAVGASSYRVPSPENFSVSMNKALKLARSLGNSSVFEKGSINKRSWRNEILDTFEWALKTLQKKKISQKKIYSLYKKQNFWKTYRHKPLSYDDFYDAVLSEFEELDIIEIGKTIKML